MSTDTGWATCPWCSSPLSADEQDRGRARGASLDLEVEKLVHSMNRLPGVQTTNSCGGHGRDAFQIWFIVTDFAQRGLLVLSRILSYNYYEFGVNFRVVLDHRDVHPQVCFLLESKRVSDEETFKVADEMAREINVIVDGTVANYNILYSRNSKHEE